jgi:hypothetical protein
MGTGNNGLRRILKAGRIPVPVVQRYLNKWIPTAYDLFGVDHSTSAEWAYLWGLKGRYDEEECTDEPDKASLNDRARSQYHAEVNELIAGLNKVVPAGEPRLYTPDLRFHRSIGDHVDRHFSVHGEPLAPDAYAKHLRAVLPGADDALLLERLTREKDWIEPKKAGAEA